MTNQDKSRAMLKLYGFLALVSIPVVIIVLISLNLSKPVEFPVYGLLPEFNLIDQAGAAFSRDDLNGKTSIVGFMFTTCKGQCPLLTANMKKIQDKLLTNAKAQLLSISVDPQYDTTAELAKYAKRFGAKDDRWFFLSGPADEVRFLAQHGFRLSALPEGSEKVAHSFRLVLVDGHARIRGYYDGLDPATVDRLVSHANLLSESRDEARLNLLSPLAAETRLAEEDDDLNPIVVISR